MLYTECIAEHVRAKAFPHLSSRWGARFVCETPEAAILFAKEYNRSKIYKVEHRSGDAITLDMGWVNVPINANVEPLEKEVELAFARALLYWKGRTFSPSPFPEILLSGDVVIGDLHQSL